MIPANAASPQPSGILLLDKPPGVSSFAALYPVKRAFGGKKGAKIGHAGTLDPAASGLLVIGVGSGTRLLEFLEGMPKRYRFEMHLGLTTDTYDLEGEVLERRDASAVTRDDIEAHLDAFRGAISQLPPTYSAIKIDGKRACDRVRSGETVTLAPRAVHVYRLEVISFKPGTATLELDCSKGTYVRSLAHDLGQALGCGAAADQIRRLAIGPFRVEDAVTPRARQDGATENRDPDDASIFIDALLPLETAVANLPALCVKESWVSGLRNGNPVPAAGYTPTASGSVVSTQDASTRDASVPGTAAGNRLKDGTDGYAVFTPGGELIAIAELNPLGHLLPRKVFPATATASAAARA